MIKNHLVELSSGHLRAQIDPLGAQLHSLRDSAGRNLQWHPDPTVWKGRAPILFPMVGALAGHKYRLNGETYSLTRHGFARDKMFSSIGTTSTTAHFRLQWDQETLQVYPFRFQLDLRFDLADARLGITATIKNFEPAKILPASFGYHPAFCWPLPYGEPKEAHAITFEKDEPAPIRRLDSHGLIAPQGFLSPVEGRTLKLRDELFAADAIIMDRIQSQSLTYGAGRGPRLEIEYRGMPYLGIWTKPGAGFICIEPWHGLADPQGFSGDFDVKPGIMLLEPGASKELSMSISLVR